MTPGVSALTNRAAVIVKMMPSPGNTKMNSVCDQAATTSREAAGLQTAASCVDTSRVIIKLHTTGHRNQRVAADDAVRTQTGFHVNKDS